jgi:uncharacterized protein (TIGR02246 family)
MHRCAFASLVLTVLAACQPATTELSEEQKAKIEAEVNAIHNEFWDAWRETDFDRGMSYYLDSPEFTFAFQGRMISGYSGVRDFLEPAFANVASQTVSFNESRTAVLAPDVVCVSAQGTYSATTTDGVTGLASSFAFTTIWVKRNGEWKVQSAITSEPTVWSP